MSVFDEFSAMRNLSSSNREEQEEHPTPVEVSTLVPLIRACAEPDNIYEYHPDVNQIYADGRVTVFVGSLYTLFNPELFRWMDVQAVVNMFGFENVVSTYHRDCVKYETMMTGVREKCSSLL